MSEWQNMSSNYSSPKSRIILVFPWQTFVAVTHTGDIEYEWGRKNLLGSLISVTVESTFFKVLDIFIY